MAKFKNLDLILNKGEKAIFNGTGGAEYLTYTTISGYNTPSGVLSITPVDELLVSVPIAGERAIEPYHLVRYDQLVSSMSEINPLDWQESVLSFSTAPPGSPVAGMRYVVSASGTAGAFVGHENDVAEYNGTAWVFQPPNEGFTLRDEDRDEFYTFDGATWGRFAATVDHSALSGLDTDDHEQYILVDGSRGFTNTVSGVTPVADSDLATKGYIDGIVDDLTGGQGAVVTISGAQTIEGDKTFGAGTLTTFLGDVFFDGINITMSGTTLTTQSNAVFNYDSTSTINNAGEVNYESGSEINHESGSVENHESGSVDHYNTGSSVTYSGAAIDVGAGTTMTFENNSSVVHEDGSTDTYELGSEIVHESGSNETHESGSNDTYDAGSTLTINGDATVSSGTLTLGNGSELVHENGSTETYESGSDTFHESGSNDTYLDGSNLTFSGSNISYEGDTIITVNSGTTTNYQEGSVINNDGDTIYGDTSTTTYEDNSTIINNGDTIYGDTSNVTYSGAEITYGGDTNITVQSGTTTTYEDGSTTINEGDTIYGDTSTTVFEQGSEVTFSGTTTFETETYFNSDIVMASGTSITIGDLVITGTISGSFTDTNRRYGQEPVINGSTSQAVLFADDFDNADYTLVATLTNQVDSPPSIYSTIQGVKTATGFTTYFSGVIDSPNFVLEWIAFTGQQE